MRVSLLHETVCIVQLNNGIIIATILSSTTPKVLYEVEVVGADDVANLSVLGRETVLALVSE